MRLFSPNSNLAFEAVAFGFGDQLETLQTSEFLKVVYSIEENHWNGQINLQLKIRDILSI